MKKERGKKKSPEARDIAILSQSAGGKNQRQIAKEFGLSRQRVNQILNSNETKSLVEEARSKLVGYATEAVETLHDAMVHRHSNMAVAVAAATTLLKGLGVLTEKTEVSVNKRFIVRFLNGEEVVMGAKPNEGE